MSVVLKYSQQYRDDPLLFLNSLWRSLTCTFVLMFKYMYTGPYGFTWPPNHGPIRVKSKCLALGHKKRCRNLAPRWLKPTLGSHSCIHSLMLYPFGHASFTQHHLILWHIACQYCVILTFLYFTFFSFFYIFNAVLKSWKHI